MLFAWWHGISEHSFKWIVLCQHWQITCISVFISVSLVIFFNEYISILFSFLLGSYKIIFSWLAVKFLVEWPRWIWQRHIIYWSNKHNSGFLSGSKTTNGPKFVFLYMHLYCCQDLLNSISFIEGFSVGSY